MSSHIGYENTPSVACVGSGYWGKNLVRNLYKLGALRVICDRNETVLASFSDAYPGTETCVALNEVLTREDIHGVVIATPAETHFALAQEALLAGKHVLVEKPLALDEKDARELVELAKRTGKTLMVGHLLQYHPVFGCLKDLAAAGELGRINYIYSHRLNLGKIRREENILWSFAPHDISMILSLAGEEPERVIATGGNYLHRRIADVTTTHLEFPSGLRAQIFVSWLHPFKEQKLVVVGDRKMAVFDDTQPWQDKLLVYPHEIRWENSTPVPTKGEAQRLSIPEAEPLKVECEHFLSCISEGHQPLTDGAEGVRVLRVLKASQKSLDERGARVLLSERPDLRLTESSKDNRNLRRCGIVADNAQHEDQLFHETAVIDSGVTIGSGTKIWHFSHILSGSKIGEGCTIGQNVVIGPNVSIGNGCKIQNNVSVYRGVTLEDGVFCGPSMVFTNVYNPRAEIKKMGELRPTLVKKGASIGANATVVCGITIGQYAFVGAGAVVIRDVKDYALVVGNPARVVGWVCQCGETLPGDFSCEVCGKKYRKSGDILECLD